MNVITIELCAEDRARLDRLAEALEKRNCESCVQSALKAHNELIAMLQEPAEADPLKQKLEQLLAGKAKPAATPENAPGAAESAQVSRASHPADDVTPWAEVAPSPVPEPQREVDLAEFQKALTLRCAESEEMKAKVRALLHEYAPAASKVPEDKRAEVLDRLAQL